MTKKIFMACMEQFNEFYDVELGNEFRKLKTQ